MAKQQSSKRLDPTLFLQKSFPENGDSEDRRMEGVVLVDVSTTDHPQNTYFVSNNESKQIGVEEGRLRLQSSSSVSPRQPEINLPLFPKIAIIIVHSVNYYSAVVDEILRSLLLDW